MSTKPFLMIKNSEKYRESLKESDESRALLRKTLEKINLSNADLWENQYMMLADEEELLKTKIVWNQGMKN